MDSDSLDDMAAGIVLLPCPHNPDQHLCEGDCVRCTRERLASLVRRCAELVPGYDGMTILRHYGLAK